MPVAWRTFLPRRWQKLNRPNSASHPLCFSKFDFSRKTGRIDAGPDEILNVLRRDIGLTVCVMAFPDVVLASLAENWTRDPFDRLIVAHAKAGKGKLISKDRKIRLAYDRAVW